MQRDAVEPLDLCRDDPDLLLNVQSSQTGTEGVILQSDRRGEHRHDSVAAQYPTLLGRWEGKLARRESLRRELRP